MTAYHLVLCATETTYLVLLGSVALSHQTENVALERSNERVVQLQGIYVVLDIRDKIWIYFSSNQCFRLVAAASCAAGRRASWCGSIVVQEAVVR
jgi:hypothetical protein